MTQGRIIAVPPLFLTPGLYATTDITSIRLSKCLTRTHVPDYYSFTRTTPVGKFVSDISQTALSASRSLSLERWFQTTEHHQCLLVYLLKTLFIIFLSREKVKITLGYNYYIRIDKLSECRGSAELLLQVPIVHSCHLYLKSEW